jgi:hypothetical protein
MCKTSLHVHISSFRSHRLVWVVLAILTWSCLPSMSLAQQPTATISALSGMVLVNGQEKGKGTVLSAGDLLETQAGASVMLEFLDGSSLELGENTKLDIAELSQTATGARVSRMKLLWGRIRANLSAGHQQAGSTFDIETPNALVGVKFSQPDVEVSYDPAKQETVGIAHTVELIAINLLTNEQIVVPVGSSVIIAGVILKIIAGTTAAAIAAESGTAAAGTSAAETTTAATTGGLSTGTKIAIGAGAAIAVGGVAAIAASTGEEDENGGNGGNNRCDNLNPPQLVSSSPPDGARNIPVSNRTLSFTFDQKMNVQHWSILFRGPIDASNFSTSWSSDEKTVYFVYNTDLPAGSVIEWILNASGWGLGFRNDCEIPLPADQYRGNFTTASF